MKKSMNSRRPALRRPQANTIWLFLGPRSGWSGSMSLSRSAAHLVWKSARVIVPAARAAGPRPLEDLPQPVGVVRGLEARLPLRAEGAELVDRGADGGPVREVGEPVERTVGIAFDLHCLPLPHLDLDPAARVALEARAVQVALRADDCVGGRRRARRPGAHPHDHGGVPEGARPTPARRRCAL